MFMALPVAYWISSGATVKRYLVGDSVFPLSSLGHDRLTKVKRTVPGEVDSASAITLQPPSSLQMLGTGSPSTSLQTSVSSVKLPATAEVENVQAVATNNRIALSECAIRFPMCSLREAPALHRDLSDLGCWQLGSFAVR